MRDRDRRLAGGLRLWSSQMRAAWPRAETEWTRGVAGYCDADHGPCAVARAPPLADKVCDDLSETAEVRCCGIAAPCRNCRCRAVAVRGRRPAPPGRGVSTPCAHPTAAAVGYGRPTTPMSHSLPRWPDQDSGRPRPLARKRMLGHSLCVINRCRAMKKDRTRCRNRVKEAGLRCHQHQGLPGGPRPSARRLGAPPAPLRRSRQRRGPAAPARPRPVPRRAPAPYQPPGGRSSRPSAARRGRPHPIRAAAAT